MFGWLSTELPALDEPTLNLRSDVHTQPVGFRQQRTGVTWDAPVKRVEPLLQQG